MSPEDYKDLEALVGNALYFSYALEDQQTTIRQLRRVFGLSTEKTAGHRL